jgi:hypothetical protein
MAGRVIFGALLNQNNKLGKTAQKAEICRLITVNEAPLPLVFDQI